MVEMGGMEGMLFSLVRQTIWIFYFAKKEIFVRQALYFASLFAEENRAKLSPIAYEDGTEAMRFFWLHKLKEKNNCYLNFHFFFNLYFLLYELFIQMNTEMQCHVNDMFKFLQHQTWKNPWTNWNLLSRESEESMEVQGIVMEQLWPTHISK